jgi:gliding motility-associated-like protein
MQRTLPSFLFILLFVLPAAAQVDCSNIGFENGNFNGWTLTYGAVTDDNAKTLYGAEISGTTNNYHYVTSFSDGNDKNIPSIPMVAPGSKHSIRIGNTSVGGDFSRIHTNYTVTAENTLFQYRFAVVLQNTINGGGANHAPYQKPGFNILIFDSNGEEIPCSSYDIQLQGLDAVDGFTTSGDLQYRNWTTGAIDLRKLVGKTITIVVTAHGCTRVRHLGYAYFDAECLKSEIKAASACADENGYLTLLAPQGFGKYKWNTGEDTQSIKVMAKPGDQYHVQMVPLGSLDESCALQLDYTVKYQEVKTAIDSTICDGEQVAVGDTVYRTAGTFVRNVIHSAICDSTVTLRLKVNRSVKYTQDIVLCEGESVAVGDTVYATTGTYVRNVPQLTGCDSIVTTNLEIVQLAISVTPDLYMTQGDSVRLQVLAGPQGTYEYLWNEPEGLSCTGCPETWAKPNGSALYTVDVTDPRHVCHEHGEVKIAVKPCGIEIPDAFSPNQDQHNEVFFVYGNSCIRQILDMTVYSRWGEVIFHQQNFAASDPGYGWPGTYKGLASAPGMYPYKIRVELKNGNVLDYKGVVNLLR